MNVFDVSRLRLNSLGEDVFRTSGQADEKVGPISRNDLIVTGRFCASEYMARQINGLYNLTAEHGVHLRADNSTYVDRSRKHMDAKLIFCAARANAAYGNSAPENADQVRNNPAYWKDHIFLKTMSAIDTEVITPLLFSVISDITNVMMNLTPGTLGRTKEITVQSNEAFLFEDSSFGSPRSATKNYLYNDTITLTPAPYQANATIKWYQLVSADGGMDAGAYYAAIMRGMYSKIMALFTRSLTTAAANTKYVPSYLKYASYSSANWAEATVSAATANGIPRDQLFAYGAYQSLQNVLPKGTASDAALTYNLGPEWMKNGFLGMVGRVPLVEVQQAMVPGTVNTTGKMIFPTDQIFIAGRVGQGLAPIQGVYAEGSPVVVELTPADTGKMEIDIGVTAFMEFAPVFASKVAVISGVVAG